MPVSVLSLLQYITCRFQGWVSTQINKLPFTQKSNYNNLILITSESVIQYLHVALTVVATVYIGKRYVINCVMCLGTFCYVRGIESRKQKNAILEYAQLYDYYIYIYISVIKRSAFYLEVDICNRCIRWILHRHWLNSPWWALAFLRSRVHSSFSRAPFFQFSALVFSCLH